MYLDVKWLYDNISSAIYVVKKNKNEKLDINKDMKQGNAFKNCETRELPIHVLVDILIPNSIMD